MAAIQYPIIYCNGIESTEAQAKEQAELISTAFGDREVTLVHNPTKVPGYFAKESVDPIVEQLVNEIQKASKVSQTVLVFAHSHGSHIVEKTLLSLSDAERKSLRIYTFAGVTVIPKKLVGVVETYVYKGDWIARGGRALWTKRNIRGIHSPY